MIEHYPTPHGRERHFELFNLADDPNERNNLAETEPAKLAELQESLSDWQDEVGIAKHKGWPTPPSRRCRR